MYRDDTKFEKEKYAIYFDCGGLGDLIAALPVVQYAIDNFKHMHILFWVPDYSYELVEKTLTGDYLLKIFSEYKKGITPVIPGVALTKYADIALATHLTDVASISFLNKILKPKEKNYLSINTHTDLTKYNLPEKYVVITIAHTTEVREFLPEKINAIVQYVKSKGYTSVFLGKETSDCGTGHVIKGNVNERTNLNEGINLLEKTSLLEAYEIMKYAKVVVGLDNGLLHLAAMSDVFIVSGFTSVEPFHREPFRHNVQGWGWISIVPPESLKCRGCQSKWVMNFGLDFRNCYYKETKLDLEIQCIKQLPVEKFIEALEKLL